MTVLAPVRPVALKGRLTFALEKAAIDSNGTLTGYGAVFGNRDDGGDIIERGFFDDVLDDFLHEGFISWSHDWTIPCAMPTKAAPDDFGLALAGSFHSDEQSQRYRTISSERLAAGLTMGLSIGYEIAPGGWRMASDGRHLLKASRLFEVALVMVPMNREAGATDVKTRTKAAADDSWTASYVLSMVLDLLQCEAEDLDPDDPDYQADLEDVSTLGQIRDLVLSYLASTAREVGTPADLADVAAEEAARADMWASYGWMSRGQTFTEQKDRVERELKAITKRASAIARHRKEGRVLSSSNRDRLQGLVDALAGATDELQDLLASSEPVDEGKAALIEIERARLLGVQLN